MQSAEKNKLQYRLSGMQDVLKENVAIIIHATQKLQMTNMQHKTPCTTHGMHVQYMYMYLYAWSFANNVSDIHTKVAQGQF